MQPRLQAYSLQLHAFHSFSWTGSIDQSSTPVWGPRMCWFELNWDKKKAGVYSYYLSKVGVASGGDIYCCTLYLFISSTCNQVQLGEQSQNRLEEKKHKYHNFVSSSLFTSSAFRNPKQKRSQNTHVKLLPANTLLKHTQRSPWLEVC